MKEIIEDFRSEGFTKRDYLVYGIVYPMCIITACLVAAWIDSL